MSGHRLYDEPSPTSGPYASCGRCKKWTEAQLCSQADGLLFSASKSESSEQKPEVRKDHPLPKSSLEAQRSKRRSFKLWANTAIRHFWISDSLSGGRPLPVHLPPCSPGLQAGWGAGEGSPHYGGRVWAEFQPLLFGVTLVWASVSTSAKQR